ncbi:hypothetical protein IscW_ISCW022366 [Ixodes scapularis]|uniref:Uncharacterized protein n=1 Tax=Ixodes scapularis TaxID=6945 RepID=B7QGF0_IXOSC|nr:hypothetical protein IscW_ISCW022366 [Ixodes scapularis]|eukprot:XP_002401534.1 hypothetical protein IscW_ISCW022366 [Ixodes scapularis]
MADPDVLVSSLASAAALAASGYLFAVGVGRIKVTAREGRPAMVSRFDSLDGHTVRGRVEAAFSSMMEDGAGDELPAVAPYDGRFHDEDDVMDGDYDSRDFVVHRNTFNSVDDYNSEDSTTHGSPQSDSLRWRPPERRHPHHDPNDRHDDDRRSPDYASSEDEADYHVDYAYEGEDSPDFVDNSDAYATDPRRYVYYPEEKELEVIPEEDEEELREQAGSREDAASDCSYGGECSWTLTLFTEGRERFPTFDHKLHCKLLTFGDA